MDQYLEGTLIWNADSVDEKTPRNWQLQETINKPMQWHKMFNLYTTCFLFIKTLYCIAGMLSTFRTESCICLESFSMIMLLLCITQAINLVYIY